MESVFLKYQNTNDEPFHRRTISHLNFSRAVVIYKVDISNIKEYFTDRMLEIDFWGIFYCLDLLEYDTIEFWYENGSYYQIIQKYPITPFSDDDFYIISEEIRHDPELIPLTSTTIIIPQ